MTLFSRGVSGLRRVHSWSSSISCSRLPSLNGSDLDLQDNDGETRSSLMMKYLPHVLHLKCQLLVSNYLAKTYRHRLYESYRENYISRRNIRNSNVKTYCLWRSGFISFILIISLQQESIEIRKSSEFNFAFPFSSMTFTSLLISGLLEYKREFSRKR